MNLLEQELHRRNLPELMRQNHKEQVKPRNSGKKEDRRLGKS